MNLPLDQIGPPHSWEGTSCPSCPARRPSLDSRLTPQPTEQLSWRQLGLCPPSEEPPAFASAPEALLHPRRSWGAS